MPHNAPSTPSQRNQSEIRGLGELGQADDSNAEGIGGRSGNRPRDDDVVFVVHTSLEPCISN
jgi:hypothetical protein